MGLEGPSKTIVVEPAERPLLPPPNPAPDKEPVTPEKVPA
jgi:hypothetical protein